MVTPHITNHSENLMDLTGAPHVRVITALVLSTIVMYTSKEKHSLRESWWDIGIGGKGGVKRRGTRF